jgi:hypothetical protein
MEQQRKRPIILPPNAGEPWTPEDDARLAEAFRAGTPLDEIARLMGRTRWGTQSRLVKRGYLQARGKVPFAVASRA